MSNDRKEKTAEEMLKEKLGPIRHMLLGIELPKEIVQAMQEYADQQARKSDEILSSLVRLKEIKDAGFKGADFYTQQKIYNTEKPLAWQAAKDYLKTKTNNP